MVFDLALIKLGKILWIRLESEISEEPHYPDKDVNDCDPEDAEKCWEITPANLATMDTTLSIRQNVLALGKIPLYLKCFPTSYYIKLQEW